MKVMWYFHGLLYMKSLHNLGIYFHGNLNGNFSVIVFNAFVAILTGSKPRINKIKVKNKIQ